jgi:hypothetical protein
MDVGLKPTVGLEGGKTTGLSREVRSAGDMALGDDSVLEDELERFSLVVEALSLLGKELLAVEGLGAASVVASVLNSTCLGFLAVLNIENKPAPQPGVFDGGVRLRSCSGVDMLLKESLKGSIDGNDNPENKGYLMLGQCARYF